jgi:hypothetical protein
VSATVPYKKRLHHGRSRRRLIDGRRQRASLPGFDVDKVVDASDQSACGPSTSFRASVLSSGAMERGPLDLTDQSGPDLSACSIRARTASSPLASAAKMVRNGAGSRAASISVVGPAVRGPGAPSDRRERPSPLLRARLDRRLVQARLEVLLGIDRLQKAIATEPSSSRRPKYRARSGSAVEVVGTDLTRSDARRFDPRSCAV